MNTEASKKQFLGEYDIEVDFKAKSLGFKNLLTTGSNLYESIYDKVNFRMIEMFEILNKIDFDIEDVNLEVENTYYWESLAGCNLELYLTIEQYLELKQSSVTTSNNLFLMHLNNTIDIKVEKEQVDIVMNNDSKYAMVKEPTKLEYYLNLIERIASINHHYNTILRTQDLETEINTLLITRNY